MGAYHIPNPDLAASSKSPSGFGSVLVGIHLQLRKIIMKRISCLIWLLAGLLLPCCAADKDSAMFRADLAHTGVYSAPGVPSLRGVKWKFHTGGQVISSPAVV